MLLASAPEQLTLALWQGFLYDFHLRLLQATSCGLLLLCVCKRIESDVSVTHSASLSASG